jgi:DNA processing protein
MKINSISVSDPCFAEKLIGVEPALKQLYYLGNPDCTGPSVAIVGTRRPTTYGIAVTTALAEGLAKRGVCIISGLALGIDALAHKGALNVGGRTVAVLANGLDTITPASHRQLALSILKQNGALLSEYEPGIPPLQFRFLERNRLVAGLADTLIVTEAGRRSGTMNTVMHALSQGKEVYAVPGNISSPMSAGCNTLIEQGATPLVDIESFIDRFAPPSKELVQPSLLAYTPEEQAIVTLLQAGIQDGEALQKQSKLDAVTFATTLTMLELRGAIRPLGANTWSL